MDICFHFPFTDYSRQPCTLVCWQDLPLMALCVGGGMQIFFLSPRVWRLRQLAIQLITPFWCHFCTSQSSSCCEEGPILASCFFGPQFDLDSSQIQGVRSFWRDGFVEAVSHMFQSFVRSYSQCYTACHLIEALPYFRGKKIALQCTTYRCHI